MLLHLQLGKEQERSICFCPWTQNTWIAAAAWARTKGPFSLISTNVLRPEHLSRKNYQGLRFLTMIFISFLWVSKSTMGPLLSSNLAHTATMSG